MEDRYRMIIWLLKLNQLFSTLTVFFRSNVQEGGIDRVMRVIKCKIKYEGMPVLFC